MNSASSPSSLPLHISTVHTSRATINRFQSLLHLTSIFALLYYRLSEITTAATPSSLFSLFPILAAELILSTIWLCYQAFLWRPVFRTTFPDRLPREEAALPPIDVFVCTTDPEKEPPWEVMNTVVSAMALDYPPGKLSVYVSDDGGSIVTLSSLKAARRFARCWVPFCQRFGIECRCPRAYFSGRPEKEGDGGGKSLECFEVEKMKVEAKYEEFKCSVAKAVENGAATIATFNPRDHSPTIEVIQDDSGDDEYETSRVKCPLLVYVAREKRPSSPHHFKAGALNVLLRVSGIMTNSPYVLVLDCDMYCNDPTSAKQAMCFHLDPEISHKLAFVQFPQKFHSLSENDIYDGQMRTLFVVRWPGMDGVQGPILSGSGFYIKREALYGNVSKKDIPQLKQCFGDSNDFISFVKQSNRHNLFHGAEVPIDLLEEAHFLAQCSYERETSWGKEIGFRYESVVEDYFTGFMLHCKGWTSVYCTPSTPAFLGSSPTNLNDTLVQNSRWNSGLFEVVLSKFSPLIYGMSQKMSLLQTLCYGYCALQPLYSFPVWCLSTLPQLFLLNGKSLYPSVSSPWFMVFALIFISSSLGHLRDVLVTGGSIQTWWNEQKLWMIKSVTAYTYGCLDAILKSVGARKASFIPTSKVVDDEEVKLYKMGKLNFNTSPMFLTPIVTLVVLNALALFGGVARISIFVGSWKQMCGQVLLSVYIFVMSMPVIEGILWRTDHGRVPISVTLFSLLLALTICLGSIALLN
ncbi:unnamed protein product [Linum tenue]|uniref:Cellulose synthase-like protein G2 n=1 Tax=Linum tenue TaxID=586396 RepID=A0AAV0RNM0_9ROSI|nr:unnamed protein product [Linum tenue]